MRNINIDSNFDAYNSQHVIVLSNPSLTRNDKVVKNKGIWLRERGFRYRTHISGCARYGLLMTGNNHEPELGLT